MITWSYRSLPSNLYSVIGYCLDSELNAMELMGGSVESYLGIPRRRSLQREWRENISMDRFKIVRKMLDDAGIRVYAYKPSSIGMDNTDKEIENAIQAASILGARSVTLEIFDGIQYKILTKRNMMSTLKNLEILVKNIMYILAGTIILKHMMHYGTMF